MKDNLTYIGVVLDESSSMGYVAEETRAGFNKFLEEQKALPGEALLTLVKFSNSPQVVFDGKPLNEVPALTGETYWPCGMTALFDAVGQTIDNIGKKLAAMPESDRPSKVIVVIMTDGEENASQEYSVAKVQEMIKHQQEKYSWQFLFIGANIDVVSYAQQLAIPVNQSVSYKSDAVGTLSAMDAIGSAVRGYRTTGHVSVNLDPNLNK